MSLYNKIYAKEKVYVKGKRLTTSGNLVDILERGCFYLMYQAVAFALELTDLYGDRWHETLREISSEMVRHERFC